MTNSNILGAQTAQKQLDQKCSAPQSICSKRLRSDIQRYSIALSVTDKASQLPLRSCFWQTVTPVLSASSALFKMNLNCGGQARTAGCSVIIFERETQAMSTISTDRCQWFRDDLSKYFAVCFRARKCLQQLSPAMNFAEIEMQMFQETSFNSFSRAVICAARRVRCRQARGWNSASRRGNGSAVAGFSRSSVQS